MSRPIGTGLGHVHDAARVGTPADGLDLGDPDGWHLHVYRRPARTTVNVLVHHHRRARDERPDAVTWHRAVTDHDPDTLRALLPEAAP